MENLQQHSFCIITWKRIHWCILRDPIHCTTQYNGQLKLYLLFKTTIENIPFHQTPFHSLLCS